MILTRYATEAGPELKSGYLNFTVGAGLVFAPPPGAVWSNDSAQCLLAQPNNSFSPVAVASGGGGKADGDAATTPAAVVSGGRVGVCLGNMTTDSRNVTLSTDCLVLAEAAAAAGAADRRTQDTWVSLVGYVNAEGTVGSLQYVRCCCCFFAAFTARGRIPTYVPQCSRLLLLTYLLPPCTY